MGWASASEIFNVVAWALINNGADATMKRAALAPLITHLRDGDWDTCDESRDEFADDPVIAELFVRELGTEFWDSSAQGEIDAAGDDAGGGWLLNCSEHGLIDEAEGTAEGHDRLVYGWANHHQAEHGGDGVVDPKQLINAGPVTR